MRVLFQCSGFLPTTIGGAEVLSYHLVKELQRRGHELLVVTSRSSRSDPAGHATYNDVKLVKLDAERAVAQRDLAELRRASETVRDIVADFKPDLLHVNSAEACSFIFVRGAATGDLRRIVTHHAPIRPAGHDGLQRRLSTDAERVVTVSEATYDDALAAMPGIRGKLSVIRNALPMPEVTPMPLPFSPPRLLCFGRIVREKGFDVVVRALANLRKQGFTAGLDIAGDGLEKEALADFVKSLGMEGQVRFLGWVSPHGVPALIDTATAVVVPSRWPEPFGLVALQAAQMGRPVIAAAVGGLPEVVAHGSTGLVVAPDDEHAMADAIVALLSDAGTARRFGAAARERARQAFDFATFVDGYERVYTQALDGSAEKPDDRDMVA